MIEHKVFITMDRDGTHPHPQIGYPACRADARVGWATRTQESSDELTDSAGVALAPRSVIHQIEASVFVAGWSSGTRATKGIGGFF